MNKEIKYDVLIKLPAKNATPIRPISTVLGPSGINVIKFCKDFNDWSKNSEGVIDTGVIIYDDLSYDILTKEQYLNYKSNEMLCTFSYMYHNWEDEKTDNIKKSR